MQRRLRALAALAILGSILVVAAPAANAAQDDEKHCVTAIVGQKKSGEFITTPPICYPTFAQAQGQILADGSTSDFQAADFTIGIHFDGYSFTGSSMSVVGSSCSGGWLNTSSNWDNRISSTWNGCPTIAHYDGYNLAGSVETTTGGGGNLSSMVNRTQSLQYY